MTKGGEVLRALSPKRLRTPSSSLPPPSPRSASGRQHSRTLFSRKRGREKEVLPDLEKTNEEFEREWGISKAEEVGGAEGRCDQDLATAPLPNRTCQGFPSRLVQERRLEEFRRRVEEVAGTLRPFYGERR